MAATEDKDVPHHLTDKAKKDRWSHAGLFILGIMTPVAGIVSIAKTDCDREICGGFSAFLIYVGLVALTKSALSCIYLTPFNA